MTSTRWLHVWPENGPPLFRIGRAGEELVAEWAGLGTLRSDLAGTWNEFVSHRSYVHSRHAQERLREHIAALLRHLHGGVTLHASGIARDGIGIALVGESGAGKSTLALQLSALPGVEMLADDTLALQLEPAHIALAPSERVHWLRPDVARALGFDSGEDPKIPLETTRPARGPVRLGALVSLVFDDRASSPVLAPIRGAQAFSALSFSLFRFALDVPSVLRGELDQLARIVEDIPVFELRRPRDLARIEESPRAVASLLQQLSREGRDS
jgi:hypothetical protein